MQLTETKVFNFTFNVEGVGFTFGIPATCRQEACDKLSRALKTIVADIAADVAKQPAN